MDQETAKKWVAALRSGEYQQCKARLYDGGNGYCCLGVLARIQGKDDVWLRKHATNVGPHSLELANPRSDWPEHWLKDTIIGKALASMNDVKGYSFADIANYVEQNWESL